MDKKIPIWLRVVEVIVCSIAVTAVAALLAWIWVLVGAGDHFGYDFFFAFAFIRWPLIGVIIFLPFLHRRWVVSGSTKRIPWALRTPYTALLLMTESVALDIIISSMRH